MMDSPDNMPVQTGIYTNNQIDFSIILFILLVFQYVELLYCYLNTF